MSSRRFHRRALLVLATLIVPFAATKPLVAAETEYYLHYEKSKSIRAVYTFEIELPNLVAQEWVLFAAQVPALTSQTNVQTTLSPGGEPARDYSQRNRALLRAQIPASTKTLQHTVRAQVESRATLYRRQLMPMQRGVKYHEVVEPSAIERKKSTAETELLNFSDKKFQAWLRAERLHRKRNEHDLDLGRRVFLAITRSLEYEYTDKMDRHAAHLCEAERADCGGMCVLFVAAMRANGVPARMLCGRWAKSGKPDAKLNGVTYQQQHVKAEFFAADIGWVPVDLSSAVVHDKTEEGLQYFGHDRGDFLTVHVDPDFEVDSIHFGRKTFALMQGFHYWVTGKGKLDGESMQLDWHVEELP